MSLTINETEEFLMDVIDAVNMSNFESALFALSPYLYILKKTPEADCFFNICDNIVKYQEARRKGNTATANKNMYNAVQSVFNSLSIITGMLPAADPTSMVLSVGVVCMTEGKEIIDGRIADLKQLENDISRIVNTPNHSTWSSLEQELIAAGADKECYENFINLLKEWKKVFAQSTDKYNDFMDAFNDFKDSYEDFDDAFDDAEDAANDYRNHNDSADSYTNPGDNADSGMGDAADDTGDAEKAKFDPLILDIDGDGYNIETQKYGAYFDLNCDGFAERINWTRSDAILAIDKNSNGEIDNGGEVFGDYHTLADGSYAQNGFEALAQYDTNNDGVIDENDEIFDQLVLWIDADGNGSVDAGELKTLDEMNIKAIDLNYEYVNQPTETEAFIGNVATFVYENDTTGDIGELWVSSDLYDTIETVIAGVSEMTDGMPNVRSYGTVSSLHTAISSDDTGALRTLVENFVAETNNENRLDIIEDILHFMCNTSAVEDGSRGIYMDAKKLAVVESLMGEDFIGMNGADPNPIAASILSRVYDDIVELYCFAMIGSQITEHLDYIKAYTNEDGTVYPYMEYFNKHMYYGLKLGTISEKTFSDVCAYLGYYGVNIKNDHQIFAEFRNYIEEVGPQYLELVDSAVYGAIRGTDNGDTLNGTSFDDIIYGNGGDDSIIAHNGNNIIIGNDGDDYITSGNGSDIIRGGSGNDELNGGIGDDNITGDDGDDVLYGVSGNDHLDGGAGNDELRGDAGDDIYIYNRGYGSDVIFDNNGNNIINFGDFIFLDETHISLPDSYDVNLNVYGESDYLQFDNFRSSSTYPQFSLVFADETVNIDDAASPFRKIHGDESGNTINAIFTEGTTTIWGFGGNDTLNGKNGDDIIYGGEGNDTLRGYNGNDQLDGGTGDDNLQGGAGDDTYIYNIGYGNDVITDNLGNNVVNLGDGISLDDMYSTIANNAHININIESVDSYLQFYNFYTNSAYRSYSFAFGEQIVNADVSTSPFRKIHGDESDNTINAIFTEGTTTIWGLGGNDTLNGKNGDDIIYGGEGNDTLRGYNGNDQLDGGTGDDNLQGGAGDDTYIYNIGYGNDVINDSIGNNIVNLGDGISLDDMYATIANNAHININIENADSYLQFYNFYTNSTYRSYSFAFGEQIVNADDSTSPFRKIHGDESNNTINAIFTEGTTTICGFDGNDTLNGKNGDDIIYGGEGNDTLRGYNGNDQLDCGSGDDFLQGNSGDDVYIYSKGYGNDTLYDNIGTNSIRLINIDVSDITVDFPTSNNNAVLRLISTGETLTIQNYRNNVMCRNIMLVFDDGNIGAIDMESASIVMGYTETSFVQSHSQMLIEFCAQYNVEPELILEANAIMDSELTYNSADMQGTNAIANQTDIQALLLAENMSAFANENAVSVSDKITINTNNLAVSEQFLAN